MKAKLFGIEFSASFPAVAFLTLAVVTDRKGTVLLCLISSFFHEMGHIAAMAVKKAKLKSVRFNLGDVAINGDFSNLSYSAEIFITVSGVFVNLILALISFAIYKAGTVNLFFDLSMINLLIAVFNLLPVRFLDGGQLIMLYLQNHFTPKISDRIINILTFVFVVPVFVSGLIFVFNSSYNYSLLFAAIYLICTLVSKEFKNVS